MTRAGSSAEVNESICSDLLPYNDLRCKVGGFLFVSPLAVLGITNKSLCPGLVSHNQQTWVTFQKMSIVLRSFFGCCNAQIGL